VSLAELGHTVAVRDIQQERIDLLNGGYMPIFEPGLEDLVVRNKERLLFTFDPQEALSGAEIAYICGYAAYGVRGR
jgi:UDPglucose 6-dehydrogenase